MEASRANSILTFSRISRSVVTSILASVVIFIHRISSQFPGGRKPSEYLNGFDNQSGPQEYYKLDKRGDFTSTIEILLYMVTKSTSARVSTLSDASATTSIFLWNIPLLAVNLLILCYTLEMPSNQSGPNAQMHVGVINDSGDQININATNVHYQNAYGEFDDWSHVTSYSIICQRGIPKIFTNDSTQSMVLHSTRVHQENIKITFWPLTIT